MISVALDKQADEDLLKATILKEKMEWNHIWQVREKYREDDSITKLFKVLQYPTFILINPEGEIIYRGVAAAGYREMLEVLDKHLTTQ